MKFDSRIQGLPTLGLHTGGAMDAQTFNGNQPLELERRREFVRAVAAQRRGNGKREYFDPVLAFHLGLAEEKKGETPGAS